MDTDITFAGPATAAVMVLEWYQTQVFSVSLLQEADERVFIM
jgi:hypothetical protein